MSLALPTPSQQRRPKTILSPDGQTAKFLYTILKQLDLKTIDWNEVARQLDITNGHAARMRYSRFKGQIEGLMKEPKGKSKHGEGKDAKTKAKEEKNKDAAGMKRRVDDSGQRLHDGSSFDAYKRMKMEGWYGNDYPNSVVKVENENRGMVRQQNVKMEPGFNMATHPRVHYPTVTTYTVPSHNDPKSALSSNSVQTHSYTSQSMPQPQIKKEPKSTSHARAQGAPTTINSESTQQPQSVLPFRSNFPSPTQSSQIQTYSYPVPNQAYPFRTNIPGQTYPYQQPYHQYPYYVTPTYPQYQQPRFTGQQVDYTAARGPNPASIVKQTANTAGLGGEPTSTSNSWPDGTNPISSFDNLIDPAAFDVSMNLDGSTNHTESNLDWLYDGLGNDFNMWTAGNAPPVSKENQTTQNPGLAHASNVVGDAAIMSSGVGMNQSVNNHSNNDIDAGVPTATSIISEPHHRSSIPQQAMQNHMAPPKEVISSTCEPGSSANTMPSSTNIQLTQAATPSNTDNTSHIPSKVQSYSPLTESHKASKVQPSNTNTSTVSSTLSISPLTAPTQNTFHSSEKGQGTDINNVNTSTPADVTTATVVVTHPSNTSVSPTQTLNTGGSDGQRKDVQVKVEDGIEIL